MKYALLVMLAATCGDDPAPVQRIDLHAQAAITDWRAHGNTWQQHCSPYHVYLTPVPQSSLPSHCGVDAQLYACLDGFTIYIAQEVMGAARADYAVEHELRHWLGGCEYGRIDGNHEIASYWYSYRGRDIRE